MTKEEFELSRSGSGPVFLATALEENTIGPQVVGSGQALRGVLQWTPRIQEGGTQAQEGGEAVFRVSIYTMANGSQKISVTEAEKAGLFCPLSALSKKPSVYKNISDLLKKCFKI